FVQRRKEVRQRSLALFGGNAASEAAVERGLDWLAAHQNPDGSWSLHNFQANCKHPHCPDAGTFHSDPAATGLGLLPFLGAGNTHQAGKHRQTVTRALDWLVKQQRPDGTWPAPGDARPMYGHGMASIALCEAYGMTQDVKLRGPAQKALDYIVRAQHGPTGGWRYYPNMAADTSVVGWQVMALKSGEMAGLNVPPQALDGVKRWLRSVEGNRPVGGLFGYQSPNPTPAMTAQGLLCLQYLGTRRDDPRMRAGTDYLLAHLPQRGVESSYYWYHATQVMYHVQGKHWKAWNDKLRDLLVSTQATQGGLAGSWQPTDAREKVGGRLCATSLRLLMLEVYYRHLPLYQQLEK
ncbi:MAG TPA: prenyltransferase/squalene oxidase repeat-containing protein, partial [Gemmataceae bacterium]|nr:prenyltransferase/squalene oxidase repeat-containing protein [Gemmataceae bacterium]